MVEEVATVATATPPVEIETAREAIVRIAREQVGTLEVGCNNCGAGPKMYLAATGLGEGYAYCGAGQYWCMKQAGFTPEGPRYEFARAAYWHKTDHRIAITDTALIADVAGYFYTKLNRIGHTELIVGESDRYFKVVGFNTTNGINRDGHGVFEKMVLKTQVTCVSRWITLP